MYRGLAAEECPTMKKSGGFCGKKKITRTKYGSNHAKEYNCAGRSTLSWPDVFFCQSVPWTSGGFKIESELFRPIANEQIVCLQLLYCILKHLHESVHSKECPFAWSLILSLFHY